MRMLPCGGAEYKEGKFQSGQMGQTVNLLAYAFGGSNPSLPTTFLKMRFCCYSSAVEHFLGKEEVPGSSPGNSSLKC